MSRTYKRGKWLQIPADNPLNADKSISHILDRDIVNLAMVALNKYSGLLAAPTDIQLSSFTQTGEDVVLDEDGPAIASTGQPEVAIAEIKSFYYDPALSTGVPLIGAQYGFALIADNTTTSSRTGMLRFGTATVGAYSEATHLVVEGGKVALNTFENYFEGRRGFSMGAIEGSYFDDDNYHTNTERLNVLAYNPNGTEGIDFVEYDDVGDCAVFAFETAYTEPPVLAVHPQSPIKAVTIVDVTESFCKIRGFYADGTTAAPQNNICITAYGGVVWKS